MAFIKTIRSFSGPHAFLSNFYPAPVQWRGIVVPTVEHGYQASKCALHSHGLNVARQLTPTNAKKAVRSFGVPIRSDWDSIKLVVMWELLIQKFCIPELSDMLVATAKCKLVEENTWGDTYWGICNGRGFNHLGQLLMVIREMRVADTEI